MSFKKSLHFIIAYSAELGEIPLYVAFHQRPYCLPMYLFTDFQNEDVSALQYKQTLYRVSRTYIYIKRICFSVNNDTMPMQLSRINLI